MEAVVNGLGRRQDPRDRLATPTTRPGIHHWRTPTGHTFTVTPSGTFQHGRTDTPQTAYERALAGLVGAGPDR